MVAMIGPLIILSSHSAVNLEYFRQDQGKENFNQYVSSAFVNPIVAALILTLLTVIFAPFLSSWPAQESN